MTHNQKQQLIDEMLQQYNDKEHDFAIIDEDGNFAFPVSNAYGVIKNYDRTEDQKGYRGYALEINDHGNVTVWNCFKNGNRREIASRV